MLPAKLAKYSPYAKFWVSVVTVVLIGVTVPLGSPAWVPIAIGVLNALGVFFTPNIKGEFEPAPTQ